MPSLKPVDIVDRDPETRQFESLLNFESSRRVLTVSDTSGRGKSTFLKKLRFVCEFRHHIPVALVPVEEFDDHPDRFELVRDIVSQLKEAGTSFAAFDKLVRARSFQDVGEFLQSYRSVHGVIEAGGAQISGNAQAAGVIFNVEHSDNVALPDWNDEADREAKQLCLAAFFAELADAARQGPLVVLFDTVDQATDQLERWIFLQMVQRGILSASGAEHRLIVVLAGNNLHTRMQSYFAESYEERFDSIPALGDWDEQDTARLFEVHGYAGLSADRISQLHQDILSRQLSLTKALAIAAIYSAAGDGQ